MSWLGLRLVFLGIGYICWREASVSEGFDVGDISNVANQVNQIGDLARSITNDVKQLDGRIVDGINQVKTVVIPQEVQRWGQQLEGRLAQVPQEFDSVWTELNQLDNAMANGLQSITSEAIPQAMSQLGAQAGQLSLPMPIVTSLKRRLECLICT